jgi:hypothetical protein
MLSFLYHLLAFVGRQLDGISACRAHPYVYWSRGGLENSLIILQVVAPALRA